MFVEKTYRIGNKFKRRNDTYVIARINSNIITLLDCETFENFGTSKQVADVENITETELKYLFGIYQSQFELIK